MQYEVVSGGFIGTAGIQTDEHIEVKSENYAKELRLVRLCDPQRDEVFEFLTNNFALPAQTIANIYISRRQIEAFFKWIEQNFKIKTFLGTNENAVTTQIWVAMCCFLVLAYLKYQTKYRHSLYYLHRLIKATIFQKLTLIAILNLTTQRLRKIRDGDSQLIFAF